MPVRIPLDSMFKVCAPLYKILAALGADVITPCDEITSK